MNTFSCLGSKGIYNGKSCPLHSAGAKSFSSNGTQRKIPAISGCWLFLPTVRGNFSQIEMVNKYSSEGFRIDMIDDL